MKNEIKEKMKNKRNWSNQKCPIRTCASCEFTYWGLNRDCPKCGFGHYGSVYVYGWRGALWQLLTNEAYIRKLEGR